MEVDLVATRAFHSNSDRRSQIIDNGLLCVFGALQILCQQKLRRLPFAQFYHFLSAP